MVVYLTNILILWNPDKIERRTYAWHWIPEMKKKYRTNLINFCLTAHRITQQLVNVPLIEGKSQFAQNKQNQMKFY